MHAALYGLGSRSWHSFSVISAFPPKPLFDAGCMLRKAAAAAVAGTTVMLTHTHAHAGSHTLPHRSIPNTHNQPQKPLSERASEGLKGARGPQAEGCTLLSLATMSGDTLSSSPGSQFLKGGSGWPVTSASKYSAVRQGQPSRYAAQQA